jgi:hypothetical protein
MPATSKYQKPPPDWPRSFRGDFELFELPDPFSDGDSCDPDIGGCFLRVERC